MRGTIILAIWLFASGFSGSAWTEEPTKQEQSSNDRKHLVADNLPLTEAEASKFWPLYEQYLLEIARLTERRRALIAALGENFDDMTDVMAKQLILDQLNYQEDRLKLMKLYLPRFEKILTAKKLARFYQIEGRIRAAVEAEVAERIPLIE